MTHKPAPEPSPCADRALTVCWVALMILTGTYLRGREAYATGMDWLVIVRLLVAGAGVTLALALLWGHLASGPGSRAILAYVTLTFLSCLTSASHKIVFGYWLLTAAAALVTLALVQRRPDPRALVSLERIWLITMLVILVKDAASSISAQGGAETIEAQRIGRDITSPAFMGLYASLAFWLLPLRRGDRWIVPRLVAKTFLLFITIASRTRMVILNLLGTAFVRLGLARRRSAAEWFLLVCVIAILLGGGLLLGDADAGWMHNFLLWFNRGLDSEAVRTLTGRVDVWSSAIRMTSASARTTWFGHGYGVTRYYLNWQDDSPEFFASHCHNAFIEHYFSMGLPGLAVFLWMLWVGARWLTRHAQLAGTFPDGFALRAASVVFTLLVASLTEVPLGGGRVNPAMLLFFFYLASMDRAAPPEPA